MPTATEPTRPTPPTGPELKLPSSTGGSGRATDPRILEAVNAAAAKNAPQGEADPTPPPDPAVVPAEPVKPNAAQVEPPKEPAKPATPPPPEEPKGIKQVRDALERRTREYEELKTSHSSTLKERTDALSRIAETDAKLAKMTEELEKDYKPRAAKLAEVEKRLIEKEEILRIRDYTATDQFHNTHVKPLADAHSEAVGYMSQLAVDDGNGQQRQATADDFNEILATRTLNEAALLAKQKFGDIIAPTLVNMKVRISGLERSRQEAVKNAAIESQKFVENQQIAMNQQREQFRNTVMTEAQRKIAESEHLKIADDDAEGKATLSSAVQFADSLWEQHGNETPQQVANRLAEVRLDVIESRVLRKTVAKQKDRIKELETRLSDYETSEPNMNPRGAATSAPATNGDDAHTKMLAAANALAAKRG